jgi:hypothetical protein
LSIVSNNSYHTIAESVNTHVRISGYDLAGGLPGRAVGVCRSPLTSGQIITYLASSASNGIVTTTLAINSSTGINAVDIKGWNVAAPMSSSMFDPTFPNTSLAPSGLSSGAKAGLGIRATLGGIGLLALIGAVFLLRRRQKVAQYDNVDPVPQQAEIGYVHEMSGQRPTVEMLQDPAELSSEAVRK